MFNQNYFVKLLGNTLKSHQNLSDTKINIQTYENIDVKNNSIVCK